MLYLLSTCSFGIHINLNVTGTKLQQKIWNPIEKFIKINTKVYYDFRVCKTRFWYENMPVMKNSFYYNAGQNKVL